MPYIAQKRRDMLDAHIKKIAELIDMEQRAGELNYTITKLMLALAGEARYKDINELIGALEAAKLEFYRRKAAPYEDAKIKENGDVY
ncbi:MAG: hypothetical protein BMS9Abin13_296 [Patescibacteria group bacterium]|nr:MAG: hypothetical protein BMS9Abin13_296 [Patescibacteria group bacterium]